MINEQQRTPSLKTGIVGMAVVVSFIIGGVTGGVAGALSGGLGEKLVNTFFPTLNQESTERPTDAILAKGTLSVTEESATVDVVNSVSPSVVSIVISKDLPKIVNPFFGFVDPSAPTEETEVGGGTGFIISSDGLILTNKHVVSDAEAKYTVVLADGTKYDAKTVDTDPVNDLAFIKVEAKDLPVVEIGDSDTLKAGQTVIAIGNSLSRFQNTITQGIVSGLNRTITAGSDASGDLDIIDNVIQTDAAINPGNSGGPLLNLAGQVVGVNTAVSREGQLIGFAIPINAAKTAIKSVQENGRIIQPFLGVRYVELTSVIAKQRGLSVENGALIVEGSDASPAITPNSPAEKAGLKDGDVILAINDRPIDAEHSLARELQRYTPGTEITLKVHRGGEDLTLKATLQEFGVSTT